MNILNKNSSKITSESDNNNNNNEPSKKSKKFSNIFKKGLKENGLVIWRTTTDIAEKIVPELEIAIKIANTIIDIYEQAKYNREICRIMTDRVELAMASIKLLKRNKVENGEKFQEKGYHKSFIRFNNILRDIQKFIEEVSGIKGFKKYLVAKYVKDEFEKIREEFDHSYKALQLAISIDQIVDFEKENRIIKKSLDELNVCYQDVHKDIKDIKENHDLVMRQISALAATIETIDNGNTLIKNIKLPQVDKNSILQHEFSKYHGSIRLMKYNALDVACKKIKYPVDKDTPESKRIRGILSIWNQLKECPYIIKFYGISKLNGDDCMIFEWAELNNLKFVYENVKLSWQLKLYIARDVFRGLCFLHFIGILHHNVKAENILVTSGYKCKISNFEFSRGEGEQSHEITDVSEVIRWMAPEKLETYRSGSTKYVRYTDACEMFSFGMFLWELSFNKVPYKDIVKTDDIIEHVVSGKRETLEFDKAPSDIIEAFTEIITLAWKQDFRDRPQDPTVSAILGKTYSTESSPLSFYEQNNNDSNTSLENSQMSDSKKSNIKVDEDCNLIFDDDDDDDDDDDFEILPFEKGIEIHHKPNKTDQDYKLAWKCFDAHAELGNKDAIYWKAHYLSNGYYVKKDLKKAIILFKKAADADVAEAQQRYAFALIENQPDFPYDKDIFLEYLTKSADNGNEVAIYNLGILYYKGKKKLGILKNKEKGIEYLKIAALKGYKGANEVLEKDGISL
ncbi:kinase-like domain-containing protein [Glomus cerebriforme]|uniref:Kinase-like domain-containing protein n=1 Tax=Glomus cerebriforme TaxID=658196 RepID=A0A397TMK2_9GLOM|nr:kinase-like domain-containing protein [Glomus cerebriforme]